MKNYNGFKGIIEEIISEGNMVEPSEEKFEKFISENKLEKKEITYTVCGTDFNVIAFYVNDVLEKIQVKRNNLEIFNGCKNNPSFSGFVSQLKNQVNINL